VDTGRKSLYVLLVMGLLSGCTSPPDRPAPGQSLPDCGPRPNCVHSETGRGKQAIDPISADREQWQQLKAWIAEQANWSISVDEPDFVQAVVKTPLMRFRDDVQLRFLPDANLIHVRSSSRLGYSDLGANRKRVEALRELVAR
jgi:uncharacterized protein (DUF1499 family)